MKETILKILKQIGSLFTDSEWDADVTKVFGVAVVSAGIVGFFMQKQDFQWVVAFGAGLISTGKFSKNG